MISKGKFGSLGASLSRSIIEELTYIVQAMAKMKPPKMPHVFIETIKPPPININHFSGFPTMVTTPTKDYYLQYLEAISLDLHYHTSIMSWTKDEFGFKTRKKRSNASPKTSLKGGQKHECQSRVVCRHWALQTSPLRHKLCQRMSGGLVSKIGQELRSFWWASQLPKISSLPHWHW